jgi:Protein of unknown function (DUF3833)
MKYLKRITALLCLVLLGACASPQPADYAGQQPALDVQRYFNGTLDATGIFQDRGGKVVKRFNVVIVCHWEGDTGTLDEDFTYSDGTRQKRIWTLRKLAPNHFTGSAADVVGTADGEVSGNALRWRYTMALTVDGTIYNVNFEDWMFLMDQDVMLNRAEMRKFGIRLGEVTLSFRKRP